METTRIKASDLKTPKHFYTVSMLRDGQFSHLEIIVYHAGSSDISSHELFRLCWQMNNTPTDYKPTKDSALSAYGCHVEMPLGAGAYYPREAYKVLGKVLASDRYYGELATKVAIRALRKMGMRRYVYTSSYHFVPRKYKARAEDYIKAQAIVAA